MKLYLTVGSLFFWSALAFGDSVLGSLHDLSTTGVDPYSDRVCVFCHTPHGANPDIQAPLWNRAVDTSAAYQMYQSSTMDTSVPAGPMDVSLICLGCHDGVSAYVVVAGYSVSTKHDLLNAPGPGGTPDTTSYPNCRRCHGPIYGDPPFPVLGNDLRNDHPVSMIYPTAAQDPDFNIPPDLTNGWGGTGQDVKLYSGRVECSSCHDVHDPAIPPFLRKSNDGSALCLTCHIK